MEESQLRWVLRMNKVHEQLLDKHRNQYFGLTRSEYGEFFVLCKRFHLNPVPSTLRITYGKGMRVTIEQKHLERSKRSEAHMRTMFEVLRLFVEVPVTRCGYFITQ